MTFTALKTLKYRKWSMDEWTNIVDHKIMPLNNLHLIYSPKDKTKQRQHTIIASLWTSYKMSEKVSYKVEVKAADLKQNKSKEWIVYFFNNSLGKLSNFFKRVEQIQILKESVAELIFYCHILQLLRKMNL
jgi:hypothetical protein